MANTLTEAIFTAYQEQPDVAVLMSGVGTNARSILSDDMVRELYNITTLVTDSAVSNAPRLAEKFGLELVESNTNRFENPRHRLKYFHELKHELQKRGVRVAFYTGFMKIATPDFCESFPGINVHPADLSVKGSDGLAKYRGMQALQQMRKDLGFVRASVHVVDSPVDSGSVISLTDPVYPSLEQTDAQVHEELKLKENCIFPQTLKLLGQGLIDMASIPLEIGDIGGLRHD